VNIALPLLSGKLLIFILFWCVVVLLVQSFQAFIKMF